MRTVNEGIDIVKHTKIQNLTTTFETTRMKDSENFGEFNSKVSDIVNLSFNLGEFIPDHKLSRKSLGLYLKDFIRKWFVLRNIQI